ncbi:Crp/Fnr family transcriptional regulator [Paucidesulfovibrio longus]|uniref:Crp/Fnr family transcriptional regulator n=1 Tax=Paucidesulfovibrio longus TaxID=889 RepID=UPI0003B693C4|nr:cyclic nucleotide-binding domain-containing protein [Paucidesulfovibrio longus]
MIEKQLDHENEEIISRLRRMRVFDTLGDRQMMEIIKLSRLRKYDPGEVLIQEGEYDQYIYFLIGGDLAIESNGTEVGHIRRLGDVFGEMGIIDGSPRSATIRAVGPSLCLAVDGAFMDRLQGADKLIAQAVFYRIFAEILAVRLRDTSKRAADMERRLAEHGLLDDEEQ